MSLKYTRPTGSLFRLTNCQNLIYCVPKNFCNDPPFKNNENISANESATKEEKKKNMNTEELKMEKLLKSFSQTSAQAKPSVISETDTEIFKSNSSKGKYAKSYSHDLKKFMLQTKDVKSDFFASLETKKSDVISSDHREKDEVSNENVQAAKIKMNELLKSLSQRTVTTTTSKIALAHPKPRKKHSENKSESFPDDSDIDLSMQKAVKDVAKEVPGDTKKIESDLFASLKSHSTETSLSELLATMKIDRSSMRPSSEMKHKGSSHKSYKDFHEDKEEVPLRSRLNDFRRKEYKKDYRKLAQVGLYSGSPLDIFPKDYKGEGLTSMLSTWDLISSRDKEVVVSNFPRNAFEEMIQWTEEGKLWTFPIDNEFGLEEEEKYGFADHIFLEHHLQEWCPKKGPIRRYMELVCTGLSKNPYITVERKKSHIEWYKNYFEEKKLLLQEIGAM